MTSYRDAMFEKSERALILRRAWPHGARVQVHQPASATYVPVPVYGTVIGEPVTVETVTLIAVRYDDGAVAHHPPARLRNLDRKPDAP